MGLTQKPVHSEVSGVLVVYCSVCVVDCSNSLLICASILLAVDDDASQFCITNKTIWIRRTATSWNACECELIFPRARDVNSWPWPWS